MDRSRKLRGHGCGRRVKNRPSDNVWFSARTCFAIAAAAAAERFRPAADEAAAAVSDAAFTLARLRQPPVCRFGEAAAAVAVVAVRRPRVAAAGKRPVKRTYATYTHTPVFAVASRA